MRPLVSVVIPTLGRPDLLLRAVRSVTEQSLQSIEIIVVVDGPDEPTSAALADVDDRRLRVVPLPVNRGSANARNEGVRASRGRWIAFLDDDDEWRPEKLQLQLELADATRHPYPIIGCPMIVRHKGRDLLWPRKFPRVGQPMSEYLFCRTQLISGESSFQSSTIFAPRELAMRVPFRDNYRRHDDYDWIMRAAAQAGARVRFVRGAGPLSTWHRERPPLKRGDGWSWRDSLSWANENRDLFTRRAYAAFLLTYLSDVAVRFGDRRACGTLLEQARQHGSPSALDLLLFSGIVLMPSDLRGRVVLGLKGRGRG